MKFPLCHDSWSQDEYKAILRVIGSGRFTMGPEVATFEREFAEAVGARYAVMVNSGSSANLLLVGAMVESGRWPRGSEIIVPAVSWSTTYFPLHQYGLIPVFVDVDPLTFNIDPEKAIEQITERTRGIFAVNLLGNPCDYQALKDICNRAGLELIADCCETFGTQAIFDGGLHNVSELAPSTYSLFFSHHLQTMEGGMITTDQEWLRDYLRSMRAHGWVRDLPKQNMFGVSVDDPFEDKFKFIVPGFNVRPLEMSGAIGTEQLKRSIKLHVVRQKNAASAKLLLGSSSNWTMQQVKHGDSSWFGFGIVLNNKLKGKRRQVIERLTKEGVETRPIVAGNFLRQPVIQRMHIKSVAQYPNADAIHFDGLFVGNDGTHDLTEQLQATYAALHGVVDEE